MQVYFFYVGNQWLPSGCMVRAIGKNQSGPAALIMRSAENAGLFFLHGQPMAAIGQWEGTIAWRTAFPFSKVIRRITRTAALIFCLTFRRGEFLKSYPELK
jgi:hypothetical protein